MLKNARHKHTEELEKRLKMVEAMLYAQSSVLVGVDYPGQGYEVGLGNPDKKRKTGHPLFVNRELSRIGGPKLRQALNPTIRNMSSRPPSPAVQIMPFTSMSSPETIEIHLS
jgi:hypothetical protein